ncbi:MAG: alpha-2-macroglobulin family protein [Saprospiraceae bacterium]
MDQLLTIGGDGEIDGKKPAERANRFDPVVMHLGPFELKKNGRATHTLQMPNYVGAVRVMVVAADKGAYGAAEKTVPVRKPLMLLATLPRVLGIGERLDLPVNLFAMKDGLGKVNIKVETTGGLVKVPVASRSVQFSKTGDDLVSFPLEVGNKVGVAKFKIIAEGGGERSTQELEIDVRNPNPQQTLTERFTVDPGQTLTVDYLPFGTEGTREGTLEMTNLPPIDLERHLQYLIRYPYGCLEQTLSGGFPQLHLATFVKMTPNQEKQTVANVGAALQRLRRFQLPNGGFSYWPGQSEVASWASNYAGHFLLAAKDKGYSLPPGMLDNWLAFQKNAARAWSSKAVEYGQVDKHSYELDQAYRLYTLALGGKPELGAMNRLRETDKLGKAARWRLAAAYALAGKQEVANELIRNVDTDIPDYRDMYYTYGSPFRDKAMILETLLLLNKKEAADRTAQLLAKEMSSSRWFSTQEIAYGLLAFSQYVGTNEELSKTYTFTMQQSGKSAIDAGSDHPYMQIALADQESKLTIKNTSRQKLFGTVIRKGQPLPAEEQAVAKLMALSVNYTDRAGNPLNPARIEQGTDFVANVVVQHSGELSYEYHQMALQQIFPSGWEITNTRFEGRATDSESGYDYRDFRDDRVHTFFSLWPSKSNEYRVYLTASYTGRFYLPAVSCGAMYDDQIYASTPGTWVEVVSPN